MNFHISPLSPFRSQYSAPQSPNAASHRHPSSEDATNHDTVGLNSGPRIEIEGGEADDEMASSTESDSEISADDITQDSRDVLVQRLNDLAQRLSSENVRTASIEALHAQVDAMERFLSKSSRGRSTSRNSSVRRSASLQPGPRPRSLILPPSGGVNGDSLGMATPMSPWFVSQFHRRPSINQREKEDGQPKGGGQNEASDLRGSDPRLATTQRLPLMERSEPAAATSGSPPQISSDVADKIVQEAEKLCAEMTAVVESLQTRREESDHLHAILIQREEMATKRILEQEGRIGALEEVVAEDESELRYLKIQMRSIEAQCMGYIPKGADPELDESIRNWKQDWSALRDKWAARRGSSFVSGDESTFSNLTSPSAH